LEQMQTSATKMEISMEVSQKTTYLMTQLSYTTLGHISEGV
jgi:hypothetical protein